MWSDPIDLYCERLGPSFWAERVNALTNIAFILALILVGWRSDSARWRSTHWLPLAP